MMLYTFGQQTFAASLPPARESGTATLCFHARTKTMLAFARSFRCLVGAFHLLTVNVDGKGRNHAAVVNDSYRCSYSERLDWLVGV
jgi:hypothetical protein